MIDPQIWRREWFLDLDPEARNTFLWAIANEVQNASGVFRPGFGAVSRMMGYDVRAAVERIQKSSSKVVYFPDEDLVWVVNFLQYQSCAGKFVLGAVANLLEQTPSHRVIVPWLSYNRMLIRTFDPALSRAKTFGWGLHSEKVTWTGDVENGSGEWAFKDCSGVGDYLALVGVDAENTSYCAMPSRGVRKTSIKAGERRETPVRSSGDTKWGKHLSRQQAQSVFEYWVDKFEKDPRNTFKADRAAKIRARSVEGLTFAEAKLAVLGCWLTGEDWPERRTRASAHSFELIFQSDGKTRGFIDEARRILKEQGRTLSDDGTQIVDIED